MWTKVSFETVNTCLIDNFMKAIELAFKKPQVLNKTLCGAQILKQNEIHMNWSMACAELFEKLKVALKEYLQHHKLLQWDLIISSAEKWSSELFSKLMSTELDGEGHHEAGFCMVLQHVIPKNTSHPKRINLYLVEEGAMICVPLLAKEHDTFKISRQLTYKIEYSSVDVVTIGLSVWNSTNEVLSRERMDDITAVFKKFVHYCGLQLSDPSKQSLRLLNLDRYNDMYNILKTKYADFLITHWSERTDAQKFVYEDIAIATYIICIFEQEQEECGLHVKQGFLDIGCGNGLLVYLLTSEGYHGTGFDIRKRKIWDWYKNVDLRERTIVPSSDVIFPEYDWLIGNHSDEMTPWIPVISARSGYNKRFFVLPCCPHDFNGKFRERKSELSVYQAYLDYVEEITETCGFQAERDTLKIPSTKRTCILGRRRKYDLENEAEIEKQRSDFIRYRCERLLKKNGIKRIKVEEDVTENGGFFPRAKVEKVRNCTQLDRDLKSRIVRTVFQKLLSQENIVEINGTMWNHGVHVALGDLVQLFSKDTLKQLKNECGGLQTLLKNHHQIFRVVGGQVSIRFGEASRSRSVSDQHYKTCLCFFHENHPNGCWQSSDLCTFAHGLGELRPFTPQHTSS